MTPKNPILALLLLTIITASLAISAPVPKVFAHGTVDQSWAPSGSASGGDAIKYHEPIGQSFTPTFNNLVAVDVNVLNDPKLDQQDTNTMVCGNYIETHKPIGQYFKPNFPVLTGFDVYLKNTAGSDRMVTMNLRFGMIGGPIQASTSFTFSPGGPSWIHVDMSSPVSVIPGDSYIIELQEPTDVVMWYCDSTNSYAGGTAITNGAIDAGTDYNFKTFGVTDKVTANIRSGSIGGPILGSATVSFPIQPFSWLHIDFGSVISLTPGGTYVLELTVPYNSGSWGVSIPGGYPGGTAIFMGTPNPTADNWFRTYGSPSPSPDFSVSSSTPLISIVQGGSGSATITVTSLNAFSSPVILMGSWVGTAPSGVNVALTSPITPPSGSTATSPLSVTADPSASIGSFTLRVTGTSAALTHTVDLSVQVSAATTTTTSSSTTSSTTSAAGLDFALASSPPTISVTQGGSGSANVMITSLNGFTSPVTLTASWVGTAPANVNYALTSPVTPPSGGTASSPLTITAGSGASTGSFTLRVTGASGSLTHTVDVIVQITATGTATTSTTSSAGPTCLIATATYGSELSPEVQLLRGFRDNSILKTSSGSGFMVAFNAWYYSFSPNVANYLNSHGVERTIMKGVLYPLIGILFVSSQVFSATSGYPEFAAILSGLLASSLIGAFYLGLPLSLIRTKIRRLRGWEMQRVLEKILGASLLIGLAGILLGEFLTYTPLMIVSSSVTVLASLFLAALATSAALSKRLMKFARNMQ